MMNAIRDKKYLKWVKSQPSAISGLPADDPHHIIGHGQGGMGTKASDYYTFPLTREEHTYLHNIGWRTWEGINGNQWRFVAETMQKAKLEGVL